MSARTRVGSWPHRRTLPYGREAVERALAILNRGNVSVAAHAWNSRRSPGTNWTAADWLPQSVRWAHRSQLEAMLADFAPAPALR